MMSTRAIGCSALSFFGPHKAPRARQVGAGCVQLPIEGIGPPLALNAALDDAHAV